MSEFGQVSSDPGFLESAAGMARAADQTILGNLLLVKNPSTAAKRKVIGLI